MLDFTLNEHADYVRHNNVITSRDGKVKEFKCINEAKRASRKLQNEGFVVRKRVVLPADLRRQAS